MIHGITASSAPKRTEFGMSRSQKHPPPKMRGKRRKVDPKALAAAQAIPRAREDPIGGSAVDEVAAAAASVDEVAVTAAAEDVRAGTALEAIRTSASRCSLSCRWCSPVKSNSG